MPACPSCKAEVDPEADLCLGCGEPLGDSPAARMTRGQPAPPAEPERVRSPRPSVRPTIADSPSAKRRQVASEPDPVRCPGCGAPSRAARCPGCGAVLRREE